MPASTPFLALLLALTAPLPLTAGGPKSIYGITMKSIDGKDVPLASYRGQVLLIVNVASRCGNTPQYKDLEALYRKYADRGLVILGFPANNFGSQEPGSDADIKSFCTSTYGVTFPMFSKISVKGEDQHPLYRLLTSAEFNHHGAGEVKWNFQKYLIARDGSVIATFAPKLNPMSEDVTSAVERALGVGKKGGKE